ncbi:MAG: ABC transporter permease subunit [Clostridiales bacterium]|nr:ABC transporter permease subunit [Clostridiales bacterium]
MVNQLNLIKNENMKFKSSPKVWIFILVIIVAVVVESIVIHNFSKNDSDWREVAKNQIEATEIQLQGDGLPDDIKSEMEDQVNLYKYALDNDVSTHFEGSLWKAMTDSSILSVIVIILSLIIASESVAGEYSQGTIKLLLIRKAKRWEVLLSKYIHVVIWGALLTLIMLITSFIVNLFFYDLSFSNQINLVINQGEVVEKSQIIYLLQNYLSILLELIIYISLAFMVSVIIKSSSIAITISMGMLLIGPSLAMYLADKFEWIKYSLFTNTDIIQYIDMSPTVNGTTMGFSLCILAVYFIVFHICSFFIFTKRDVY